MIVSAKEHSSTASNDETNTEFLKLRHHYINVIVVFRVDQSRIGIMA